MGDLNRLVDEWPCEHVRPPLIEVNNETGWRTLLRLMLNLIDDAG